MTSRSKRAGDTGAPAPVHVRLTTSEFRAIINHLSRSRESIRTYARNAAIGAGAVFAVTLGVGWLLSQNMGADAAQFDRDAMTAAAAAALFYSFVFFPFWTWLMTWRRIAHAVRQFDAAHGGEPCVYTVTFGPKRIHYKSHDSDSSIPWQQIRRVEQTKQFVLLHTPHQTAYGLPNHAFESSEHRAALAAYAASHSVVARVV